MKIKNIIFLFVLFVSCQTYVIEKENDLDILNKLFVSVDSMNSGSTIRVTFENHKVQSLELNNAILSPFPQILNYFKLSTLSLNDCSFKELDLKKMNQLTFLDISSCKVPSKLDLRNLNKLSDLVFTANKSLKGSDSLLEIQLPPHVNFINLSFCNFNFIQVEEIKNLEMNSLYLNFSRNIDFEKVFNLFPNIQELSLINCKNMSKIYFLEKFNNLTSIKIDKFGYDSIKKFVKNKKVEIVETSY